jgi:pimeloyl-ACP methyl ester carboxylesterase
VTSISAATHRRSLPDSERRVLFLPGAAGAAEFWAPVAERLPAAWTKVLLGWPGAGEEPHLPSVSGFEDLVTMAAAALAGPGDVVAQSMGGIVAIGLALRHPEQVRRLVLVATSGGIDVPGLGGADWRAEYRQEYPDAAPWITAERPDHTDAIEDITAPTLLLWSDDDPISPVAVGERLDELLPESELRVIPAGGGHGFARERPRTVASMIAAHLR